jgi:hypothetical protein
MPDGGVPGFVVVVDLIQRRGDRALLVSGQYRDVELPKATGVGRR